MKDVTKVLQQIETLYYRLEYLFLEEDLFIADQWDDLMLQKQISNQIIDLIEVVLQQEPYNIKALFYKINIYDGPVENDDQLRIELANLIIEKHPDDLKSLIEAHFVLASIYFDSMQMPLKAIKVLDDSLLILTQVKEQPYVLVDHYFASTYRQLAMISHEQGDHSRADAYCEQCLYYAPFDFEVLYYQSLRFLEIKEFVKATLLVKSLIHYHSDKNLLNIVELLDNSFNNKDLEHHPDLVVCLYHLKLKYSSELKGISTREFVKEFTPWMDQRAYHQIFDPTVLIMRIEYFIYCETNDSRLYKLLEVYFSHNPKVNNQYYFYYFKSARALGNIPKEFSYDLDGSMGMELSKLFYQQAVLCKQDGQLSDALVYYCKAREISQHSIYLMQQYAQKGIGSKVNSHSIVLYRLVVSYANILNEVAALKEDFDHNSADLASCIVLLKQVYLAQENLEDWQDPLSSGMLDMIDKINVRKTGHATLETGRSLSLLAQDYSAGIWFSTLLEGYLVFFSDAYIENCACRIKCYIKQDQYDKVLSYYREITQEFIALGVMDQGHISQMIYIAAEVFSYVRNQRKDYELSISLTNEFFKHPVFSQDSPSVANINKWFALAWAYHGLGNESLALEYFTLIKDTFKDNPVYKDTIEQIPRQYVADSLELQTMHRLKDWFLPKEDCKVKEFSLHSTKVDHCFYMQQSIDLVLREWKDQVGMWVDSDTHIEIHPKHLKDPTTKKGYNTYITFYLKSKHITARFLVEEYPYHRKSFFGRVKSLEWQKDFSIWIHHHNVDVLKPTHIQNFKQSNVEIQQTVQNLWNKWLSNSVI